MGMAGKKEMPWQVRGGGVARAVNNPPAAHTSCVPPASRLQGFLRVVLTSAASVDTVTALTFVMKPRRETRPFIVPQSCTTPLHCASKKPRLPHRQLNREAIMPRWLFCHRHTNPADGSGAQVGAAGHLAPSSPLTNPQSPPFAPAFSP